MGGKSGGGTGILSLPCAGHRRGATPGSGGASVSNTGSLCPRLRDNSRRSLRRVSDRTAPVAPSARASPECSWPRRLLCCACAPRPVVTESSRVYASELKRLDWKPPKTTAVCVLLPLFDWGKWRCLSLF